MPRKYREMLYELYISSLASVVPDQTFAEPIKPGLPEERHLTFVKRDELPSDEYALILAHESKDYEITSLVLGMGKDGKYMAYKISSFLCFASEYDIIFGAGNSSYLLEMDNFYYLETKEVKEGVVLGYLSSAELADVNSKIESYLNNPPTSYDNTELSAPENKFRIKEHELTLEYRSRHNPPLLWLPQYQLQYKRNDESVLAHAAADGGLDEMFKILETQKDKNVYFAREFSLQRSASNDLTFITDAEYIGQKAEILCGEIVVFRGTLPKELVLAHFMPLSVDQAQRFLNVNVRMI